MSVINYSLTVEEGKVLRLLNGKYQEESYTHPYYNCTFNIHLHYLYKNECIVPHQQLICCSLQGFVKFHKLHLIKTLSVAKRIWGTNNKEKVFYKLSS